MSEKYGVTFFQPGQIFFQVAGNPIGSNLDLIVQGLIFWANKVVTDEASPNPPNVKISKSNRDPVQFKGSAKPSEGIYGKALLSKKSDQSRPFIPPPYEKRGPFTLVSATVIGFQKEEHIDKLLDLVLLLDKNRKDAKDANESPIPLQLVSPNWLMSGGSSDPGGVGGPGGIPVQYDDGKTVSLENYRFNFDSSITEIHDYEGNGKEGEGVIVAVLDTAPFLEDNTIPRDKIFDEIYKTWVTDADDTKKHALLQSLLEDPVKRRKFLEPDGGVDTPELEYDPDGYLQAENHDYLMSDHGLFVAGIIHSLAPKAEIHLFQVLNRYGVGDLMGIARGLKQVIDNYGGNNLVVNMSLTMQFPLEEAHIGTDDAKGRELGMKILNQRRPWCVDFVCMLINWFCKVIYDRFHIQLPGCEESWFERQALPLLSICRSVSFLGSDIIAAAGNKRNGPNSQRPQAEYPAAFQEVLGIGALPKFQTPPANPNTRLSAASYSNFSDRPRGSGIATLGGEKGENGNTITSSGVLGIYVGGFPKKIPSTKDWTYKPNTNGWAYWCGTSFATAIVSGLTANMLSNGKMLPEIIDKLENAQPSFKTEQNEAVLFATQGPPPTSS